MSAAEFPGLRSGFIHVPYTPSQAIGKPTTPPTMSIENCVVAIKAAIKAIVEDAKGLRQA